MQIFAFLIIVLFADFAMGDDIRMCLATKIIAQGSEMIRSQLARFVDFYIGVKACSEAGMALRFPSSTWGSFYFVMGNPDTNTFQLMNNDGQVLVDSGVVLDCNEMKYFWMNKANGVLTVGRGLQSGTDTLITYLNPLLDRLNWGHAYFEKYGAGVAEFEKQCGERMSIIL
ncbi:hypothetical protein CAPTEDRAFT_210897 [Capitella teleta]|uniref:Uncharacterized protein n=1 Tax=Capitella teleta TaxID=283909 RepID=R7VDP7_CAPTE|nr:hypothetical protein CAPTEDRAFT_210897 [Capitella teleta]|eukprot:ELU14441.1 hypothetical protein CAPTEDRAFT_210897 [Capitella teleta]